MKHVSFSLIFGSVLGLALAPLLPRTAHACGGFWCSQSAPVNQAAEQIIFVDNPDDTVTAVIQIQYVGPSERFAWVIPMPGVPEVDVSSNMALSRLNGATAPQYNLEQTIEGECMPGCFNCVDFDSAVPGAAPPGEAASADGNVTIEAQGTTGPYDWTVISLRAGLSDPADVAVEWFIENGYDLSGVDSEVLGPYLADGLNLLAFRLTKGQMSGAIRPVVLTYESDLPMIPLRPTAVAAQDDMGIQVWVAGHTQAIPFNYKSLVVNEALINWFNYRQNYDEVVTAAADQAGGQGFVTELAAPMEEYTEIVFSPEDEQQWTSFMTSTFADGIDAMWEANWRYRGWDGWRETIEASVSLPEGTDINDFARNPDAYRGVEGVEIDIDGFTQALFENVVRPVRDTQELLNTRPYLTRLYSTMSADEMTVDPAFDFNSDLADVSNIHTAQQYIQCSPELQVWEAPWRIELPQGGVILGEGSQNFAWPIELDAMPANLKVVQLSTQGAGETVTDNSGVIGEGLFMLADGSMGEGSAIPDPPDRGVMIGETQTVDLTPNGGDDGAMPTPAGAAGNGGGESGGSGGLCAVSHVGSDASHGSFALLVLGLAGLAIRRRL